MTKGLVTEFYRALKPYSDVQVKEAGYKCLDELEFFPKIAQVVSRLPKAVVNKHNEELRKRFTCPVCGDYVTMIIEGKCWYCHTGVARIARPKWKWDVPESADDFRIEQGVRCEECGHIGLGIKEPSETGIWKCRQCYSGLTIEEISARFKALRSISKYGFPPHITTPDQRFEYMKNRARELM